MSASSISSGAELIARPEKELEPLIDRASVSANTLSSTVDSGNVPDPDEPPAEIVTAKVSWPAGIE